MLISDSGLQRCKLVQHVQMHLRLASSVRIDAARLNLPHACGSHLGQKKKPCRQVRHLKTYLPWDTFSPVKCLQATLDRPVLNWTMLKCLPG